jgi:hypothetical protein
MSEKIELHMRHKTHREKAINFLLLLLVLGSYFGYLWFEYGMATGGAVTAITWSFFVLCTPVADAGFLLDFPIRFFFGVRMLVTEIMVWVLAISINLAALHFAPLLYDTNFLTSLFHKILTTPYPYWAIILLAAAGTFLSVYFGDEMLDVTHHKEREKHHAYGHYYRLIAMASLFILIVWGYYHLLGRMGIDPTELQSGN